MLCAKNLTPHSAGCCSRVREIISIYSVQRVTKVKGSRPTCSKIKIDRSTMWNKKIYVKNYISIILRTFIVTAT